MYKAKWLSKNREIACKVITVPSDKRHLEESFKKEVTANAELSGTFFLKTYGYTVQERSSNIRQCMLVMEFMSRGSLSNVLKQKHMAHTIVLQRTMD